MAGAVKIITFAERQPGIPECGGVVYLKFTEGDVRAEYLSGSELKDDDLGTWSYQFLVQADDLVGSLTFNDIKNCNLIEPYWDCVSSCCDDEQEDECEEVRRIGCFENIEIIETLGENDYAAVLRHNEECDTFCLAAMDPYQFVSQASEEE